jgi:hypothetical protein
MVMIARCGGDGRGEKEWEAFIGGDSRSGGSGGTKDLHTHTPGHGSWPPSSPYCHCVMAFDNTIRSFEKDFWC